MPAKSLTTTSAPSLPSTEELRASFKPDERAAFWYLKQELKELTVEESDEGQECRKHLEPVLNGFPGRYHQVKLGEMIYRKAVEKHIQPLIDLGELEIGRSINRARGSISDLLSLTKRREIARITANINDSGQ